MAAKKKSMVKVGKYTRKKTVAAHKRRPGVQGKRRLAKKKA